MFDTRVRRHLAATAMATTLAMAAASPAIAADDEYTIACGDTAALISAIESANEGAAEAHIHLAEKCTYGFTDAYDDTDAALPEITGEVMIHGNKSTLERSGSASSNFRLLTIAELATVDVEDLTITDGKLSGAGKNGGGIHNSGTLTLKRSRVMTNSVESNEADTQVSGGGIFNAGTLTISDESEIRQNTVSFCASGQGGGIISVDGTVLIEKSSVWGNRVGGGHKQDGCKPEIAYGGGIFIVAGGEVTLRKAVVAGNTIRIGAGGGIAVGFGVLSTSKLTAESSRVERNEASQGGGIYNAGTTTLKQSAITGNRSDTRGGGIWHSPNSKFTRDDATRLSGNRPDNQNTPR